MTRLVIVGNGMVGSRFALDLLAADDPGRFEVDQFGAEDCRPYNRVLLSDVVSGARDVASIGLPQAEHPRVRVHQGCTVVGIDREDRAVLRSDGLRTRYDLLVLATGSAARLPDLPGLAGGDLPRGVKALRTIDDARAIAAASLNARNAVVLGAGVLGLEVACGLRRRGVCATVVHPRHTLMERQLDADSSAVVRATLDDLAIDQRVGVNATGIDVAGDRVTGVRLDSGEVLPCDLLVIAVGTLPDTRLAAAAGLGVDRGIRVTDTLVTTHDRRIFAIGDCAQPPEGSSGLVAQGWSQSRRLAARLTESTNAFRERPRGVPSPDDVVRLKAPGLDVVTMGICGSRRADEPGQRTLRLSDPGAGRHIELVITDDRLAGATLVGAGPLAAQLLTTYTQGGLLPRDPLLLLLDRAAFGSSTEDTADRLVCRCNDVRAGEITDCIDHGATTVDTVAAATRATTGCGSCREDVCALLAARRHTPPVLTPAKHP
ncbi:MAG: FAD-dependent oxidoreductase [Dermatophilaceae bacterium]